MWYWWTHKGSGASSACSAADPGCPKARAGSSLIEVMVGVVLLAVIAVAGASYLYHSRVRLGVQKAHRVAVELANARLEAFRKLPRSAMTNIADEVYTVDGRAYTITRKVAAASVPGSSLTNCLRVTVSVEYRQASGESVSLSTLHFPSN